ncbi:transposase [Streptococcus pneumoniae]|uniref:transposase n=1 Tax=Streptococcus pneumoniae TaxID=1313 RepID=UPI00355BE60B
MPTFQNCWKEGSLLHSQPYPVFFPELTRKQSIVCDASTLNWSNSFYSFTQLNQLIVDIDSTHFTTYGKQEGVAYNAHYRAHGYHPLYAFEGKTG